MDLSRIQTRLARISKESKELDWELEKIRIANVYKVKIVDQFSPAYRKLSETYTRIGDDLLEFFKREPMWEYWLKQIYFKKRMTNQPQRVSLKSRWHSS